MIKIIWQHTNCFGEVINETEVARFSNENWAKLFNTDKIMELYNGHHPDGMFRLVFKGKERKTMTDKEKFIQLLTELGVEFEVDGNTIYISNLYCDGAEKFGISFWDGKDYLEGSFKEFWVVPERR